ncbi:hypothetical protein PRIPAC_73640 [Pristionchus pacificus]|uniref:Uncharacterized protein n=1 Tax=Pristionchus pacificus TaxID=54126 RepID=A0A2A6C805_PRIPA|nr:hypothetical protein PRIPAC_73640 [Pristionchus pacificus]|eukprot:PDM74236.1 hypothetical protein PRIPAC_41592 [Pristionchus pacificus]
MVRLLIVSCFLLALSTAIDVDSLSECPELTEVEASDRPYNAFWCRLQQLRRHGRSIGKILTLQVTSLHIHSPRVHVKSPFTTATERRATRRKTKRRVLDMSEGRMVKQMIKEPTLLDLHQLWIIARLRKFGKYEELLYFQEFQLCFTHPI